MGEMNVLGGGLARTSPPKMFAIPSSGVRQPFADFQAGKAPTLTRRTPMAPAAETGFVADYMTSTKGVLAITIPSTRSSCGRGTAFSRRRRCWMRRRRVRSGR